jgi:hypothetical protein
MIVLGKVKNAFEETEVGTEFNWGEIIRKVISKHGGNRRSIIPSDYCYNRMNLGIDFENYLHIFEYLGKGLYKYLGENFNYNGKIYHKSKGGTEEIIGEWENGVMTRFDRS